MKKLLPLLLILITANALAQYKPDTTHIKIVTATAEMILNDMSGTQENDMFTGAAKKIGIPENKIPEHNPFSDDYNPFASYASVAAYDAIRSKIKLANSQEELAKKQEYGAKLDATITKQNIHIIY